jgi:hypothetical protein
MISISKSDNFFHYIKKSHGLEVADFFVALTISNQPVVESIILSKIREYVLGGSSPYFLSSFFII